MPTQQVIYGLKKNTAATLRFTLASPSPAGVGDGDIFKVTPTLADGDAKVSVDGAAFASTAVGSLSAGTAAGVHVQLALSASEMNGTCILVTIKDQTATEDWQSHTITIYTSVYTVDELYARIGAPVGASISADIATIDANVDAILVDTATTLDDKIDAITTTLGTAADTDIATDIANVQAAADGILVDTDATIPALIAVVDGVADAIKAKTDLLTFTGTDVKATLDSETVALTDGAITAAKIATGAIDADSLAADALTAIENEVLDAAQSGHNTAGTIGERMGQVATILGQTGTTGARVLLTQAISEGQTARTLGGAMEASEAARRNRVFWDEAGGTEKVYRSDGTTVLITRTIEDEDEVTT